MLLFKKFHWQNIPGGIPSSCSNSEFPVWEKTLYKVGQSPLYLHAMQVFHYSETPGGVLSPLQIKEDCYKVLFLDVDLCYGGFQFSISAFWIYFEN